jgi:hypothetical protein
VLTRDEVKQVLGALRGDVRLVVLLLYVGGLRLGEALGLRVKDLDLERGVLTVRAGNGRAPRCAGAETPRRVGELGVAVGLPGAAVVHRPGDRGAPAAPLGRDGDSAGRRARRASDRVREANHLPHVPALLCDAPARGRVRHSHDSGAAGAQRCSDDDGLHPRPEPRRTRGHQPRGPAGAVSTPACPRDSTGAPRRVRSVPERAWVPFRMLGAF